jgi:peptide/nickel transport system ATP-binding protein
MANSSISTASAPPSRGVHAGSAAPLIQVKDLKVDYLSGRGPVRAVDGVSFQLKPGEVLGLAGESGSGKSTIAQAILRILQPPAVITGGSVLFGDQDVMAMNDEQLLAFRWRDVSMVFQSAMNALNPVMTIGMQIADVIMAHENVSQKEALRRAKDLLEVVGIEANRIDSYPHQLSGGMRQRAVIAIALALKPPLMIMDEPTTALDVVVQKEILLLLMEVQARMGNTILIVSHDMGVHYQVTHRMLIMYAGKAVEYAGTDEIFTAPLHPYTRMLISSLPTIGDEGGREGIPGRPPSLWDPPAGCRFADRCPLATELCRREEPAFLEHRPGHFSACHYANDVDRLN